MADTELEKDMSAWNIAEKDFPHHASAAEKLAFCIKYAVLAHSTYNSQPWYFRIKNDTAFVHIDRRYALSVIDPDDREAVMACSGAMFHLRLALRHFGYKELTEISPDKRDPSLVGKVTIGERKDASSEADPLDEALFDAIPTRHLNFSAFSNKEVPEKSLELMQKAANKEGAWLHICNEYERMALSNLIIEGDHMQMSDKRFRRELASWKDPRRALSNDGMPSSEFDFVKLTSRYTTSRIRRFEMEGNEIVSDDKLNDEIPVMAILGSVGGGMVERIYAGQALARVLLRAEAEGLSVSTLNQPCEVPELRLRLHDEISQSGRAQAILRIGYGGKPTRTPRRPALSVIEWDGKAPENMTIAANDSNKAKKGGILGRFSRLFVAK